MKVAWILLETRIARRVPLQLKTNEFNILTRSHTPTASPSSYEELAYISLSLQARVDTRSQQRFRLVGIGLINFRDRDKMIDHPVLFT